MRNASFFFDSGRKAGMVHRYTQGSLLIFGKISDRDLHISEKALPYNGSIRRSISLG
jgi:hypothetical protein